MSATQTTALVTGGSRGIGRAIARELAARGCRVAVHYVADATAAETTRRFLAGDGHVTLQAELGDAGACRDLVGAAEQALGALDIVVNNAGVYAMHRVAEIDFESWCAAWDRTLAVNLSGPAHVSYAAARAMIPRGSGRIVNVSSRGAFRGEPEAPAYGASKAGLNALSQSLAQALAPHGIFVGVVAPGFVDTDMAAPHLEGAAGEAIRAQSPLQRVAAPEEIARAVAFLALEEIGYLTGCIIDANGASYLRT